MAASPSKALATIEGTWDPEALPPFPAVALKALNLMAGRDSSLPELCNLIRSDVAFSSAILRIANSPLVAFSKNITSVLQASMLLGFQRLKSVVITVGLKAYLEGPLAPRLRACWRHSVACAMIAERSAKWSGVDKDFAYTAGIMHDIGRIAMAAAMPERYVKVVEAGANCPEDLLPRERSLFGVDHCEVGRSLVTAWNLPMAFLEVTSEHHETVGAALGIASVLRSSCKLADALSFGVVQYRCFRSYSDVLAEFSEPARNHFPDDPEELRFEVANEIKVIESA